MMRRHAAISLMVAALALVAAMAGLSTGCAKPAPAPAAKGGPAAVGPAPGVTKLADGTSRAVGTLQHLDLEGGVWVIKAMRPSSTTQGDVKTLAVITNPELFEIDALIGKYVEAVGTIDTKAVSINMAGPQMQATTITAVTSTGK